MIALKAIAEAIETTLLNGVALCEIQDYHIEIIPDDRSIVVQYIKKVSTDHVHVEFKLQSARDVAGESNEERKEQFER